MNSTKVNSFYSLFVVFFSLLLMVLPCGVWWIFTFAHLLLPLLIMLSSLILSSLSFANYIVKCAFILFFMPSHVVSLLQAITIMTKSWSYMDGIFGFDFSHSHAYCYYCYCCQVLHYHLLLLIMSSNVLSSSPSLCHCLLPMLKL